MNFKQEFNKNLLNIYLNSSIKEYIVKKIIIISNSNKQKVITR
jgi:hypothetical protein